jgi:hypothetical protein
MFGTVWGAQVRPPDMPQSRRSPTSLSLELELRLLKKLRRLANNTSSPTLKASVEDIMYQIRKVEVALAGGSGGRPNNS